jgi:hypothetical protein
LARLSIGATERHHSNQVITEYVGVGLQLEPRCPPTPAAKGSGIDNEQKTDYQCHG